MNNKIDRAIELLKQYDKLGLEEAGNGTLLIGKAPHIAPKAWLHKLYKPLDKIEIAKAGSKLNIPKCYQEFLELFNGLKVFNTTFALYGFVTNHNRSVGNWQPFDLYLPNVDERLKDAVNDEFFIGGYDWDGSLLYIKNNKVCRCCRESVKPINIWESLEDMLLSEVIRLIPLFDNKGQEIDEDKPTIPV